MTLSHAQDEKYAAQIRTFYERNRRMPTFSEVGAITGIRSKNAVSKLVDRLHEAHILQKDIKGRLIPRHLYGEVRILGLVEAGFPSHAEEELIDTVNLDDYLIENKEATFMLRVSGNSMKDAGIQPGDLVIVERNTTPHSGDIVIAEIDGEWTMKYYKMGKGGPYLKPANDAYVPLYPEESLRVAAVVKAVVRKYGS